jgi:hypothetical protein
LVRKRGRYKLDSVGVQDVMTGQKGHSKSRGCFFYEKGNENKFGAGFYVHHRIVSAVKRVMLVSDEMSYIVLRGHWCIIIV